MKSLIRIFLLVFIIFLIYKPVFADEISNENYKFDSIVDEIFKDSDASEAVKDIFNDNTISLSESIKRLVTGEDNIIDIAKRLLKVNFSIPFENYRNIFIKLTLLSVCCALFALIPKIFGNEQTSQTGYYISFLMLVVFIISVFTRCYSIVKDTINVIIFFMNALIPAYLTAVAISGGINTSILYKEFFMTLIYICENIVVKYICPSVMVYLLLGLVNQINEEDRFSKATEVIRSGVTWVLKSLTVLIIGFQLFQGMITPYIDKFNQTAGKKIIEAIPGIGDIAGSSVEIVVGAAFLIKNAIGVIGLIIIAGICVLPLIQISGYCLVLIIVNAILQPILPSRLQSMLELSANASKLLMKILISVLVFFIISLTIITSLSGGGI